MKTKEKKKNHYGLLVLLFLLIGLGIQVGLGYQRLTLGETRSKELLEELSLSAQTAAENETQRRGALWQEAAPRLTRLPEERQAAREGEDLSLLMLVNASHPLPEDYAPELQQVEDKDGRTYQLDVCCAQAFWDMMADCAAAGGEPYICSGFRLRRDQEELYQDKIKRLMETHNVTADKAREIMLKTDKRRSSYYNYYSNKRWGDSKSYDLCINSSKCTLEGAVDVILAYAEIAKKYRR